MIKNRDKSPGSHTAEEYSKAVKLLKLKIMKLEETNLQLEKQFNEKLGKEFAAKKGNETGRLRVDTNLKQSFANNQFQQIYINEQVFQQASKALEERGMTLEMLFRCVDSDYKGEIKQEDFKKFMVSLDLGLSDQQVGSLVNALDEDCSGVITSGEYLNCLTQYSMLREGKNCMIDMRNSEMDLLKNVFKQLKGRCRLTTSDQIWKVIDTEKQGYATLDDMRNFFIQQNMALKEMELFAFFRLLDPEKSAKVTRIAFNREFERVQQLEQGAQLDVEMEMRKFKELFVSKGIKPIQAFRIADKQNKGVVSTEQLREVLKQLFQPDAQERQLLKWISLIDSNQNECIETLEFQLALLTEEDLEDMVKEQVHVSQREEDEIMSLLRSLLKDQRMTAVELFKRIDRNHSGEISLVELRSGLLDLGFKLGDIVLVMKVFDKNLNGSIEEQEFLNQFDGVKTEQKNTKKEETKPPPPPEDDLQSQENQEQLIDAVKKLQKVFKLFYPGLSMQHQKLFKQFDKNGDGNLDYQEFLEGLDSLRSKANLSELQKRLLIRSIDGEHTGNIKFQEFVTFLNQFDKKKKELEQDQQQEELKKQQEQEEEKQRQQEAEKEEQKRKLQQQQQEEAEAEAAKAALQKKKDSKKASKQGSEKNMKKPKNGGADDGEDDTSSRKGDQSKPPSRQEEKKEMQKNPKKPPQNQKQPSKAGINKNEGNVKTIAAKLCLEDPSLQEQYEMVKSSLGSGQKFTDPEFPPDIGSLTKDISTFTKAKEYAWARITEILEKDSLKIFQGSIEPNDIKQGGLGDCYFLSSLSVLAEGENLVNRLFETKEPNEEGCYCVWLCHDAQWRQVILDDYFPVIKQEARKSIKKQLAFSRASGEEMWVLLMEKAYAKVYGAYDKIEAGLTCHALRDLTGAPGEYLKTKVEEPDISWEFIMKNQEKKYLLTAGSQENDKGKEIENQSGIISGHAYAILQAAEVTAADGSQARLVQLRNPWGSKEWTGAWNDKSENWTPELKAKLNLQDVDDGAFFMPIEDFCKQFSEVSVCMLHENYFYSWKLIQGEASDDNQKKNKYNKAYIVRFKVDAQKIHGFIQVSQPDERNFAKDPNIKYQYSQLRLAVCRGRWVPGGKSGSQCEVETLVADSFKSDRDVFVETDLEQGEYFVYLEADWLQNYANYLVVSAYTEIAVSFEQDLQILDVNSEEQLTLVQRLAALKPIKEEKLTKYEDDQDVMRYQDLVAGYLYIIYKNQSQRGAKLDETVKIQATNLSICPPFTTLEQLDVTVSAGETKIVLLKIQPEAKGAYSFSQEMSYSLTIQLNNDQLVEEAKKQKQKQREGENGPIPVYFYCLFYDEGLFIYYENLTEQTYIEELQLKVGNLEGVGFDVSQPIDIRIDAGGCYQLKLKPVDANEATTFGCSYSGRLE